MNNLKVIIPVFLLGVISFQVGGCPGCYKISDLVPFTESSGPVGFCNLDSQGKLVIIVKNQGTASAPASHTLVEFFPGGQFLLSTPAITEGASAALEPLAIPANSWNPDSDFLIIVDYNNEVNEANEDNNNADGRCIDGIIKR